ncbi:MAG TPA: PEGA domain-containing protein [Terriglobales bacterium]|nr:PEGA domain-containing protein [Terriglobales bacterium]
MATMFGRFEIQSELSQSETALIYKAIDMETNQVVALKTQSLEPLGDRADSFVDALIAEGESTRDLASQNIVLLYGAGEIDGQFCAAMEYIQGNSVATMLTRKEGFSIWDLLDITRQVCAGLEQAATKGVAHHSLEPAKIMVQWDGMVKILGYGISSMSLIEAESGKGLGRLMPYCSPEQIRGEAIDLRSNLFTLGAILYEMVVSRKAFDAADPVTLLSQIENDMPSSPSAVNSKIHPAVSALIMRALAKNPADRYQSARELVDDLEKCKENGKKTATDPKKTTPAPSVGVNSAARAAAASKFVSAASGTAQPVSPKSVSPVSSGGDASVRAQTALPAVGTKAAAAAAGAVTVGSAARISNANFAIESDSSFGSKSYSTSDSKSGARLISDFAVSAPESQAGRGPVLSAAVVEQESEQHAPRVAVDPMMSDPMMSDSAAVSPGTSFSDLAEMPPLKEPVFVPPVPEPTEPTRPVTQIYPRKDEKPKIQPREVAQKAIHEMATVPPRLMIYSILGAVGLILVVALAIFFHVRSEDDGSTAAPRSTKPVKPSSPSTQLVAQIPVAPQIETPAPPIAEAEPSLTVRQVEKRNSHSSRRPPAPVAPVAIPGQALIDSSPQGAEFQVDGKSDPSWVTPFNVPALGPGKHIVSASKSGYSSEIRSVDVVAGGKTSLVFHLSPVNALMVVNSTPPGADVMLDGKPTRLVTPTRFAVEKGSHTVLLRKPGYLDETVTADLGPAQNFQYSPVLRALGNADEMRTVGKFNKLFGQHGGDSTAGMGAISIHTQPKGAQIAINQRVLDKISPVDVMLGPGNYVVDITLTGFKPVHKVISVDRGSKAAIDEILERQ